MHGKTYFDLEDRLTIAKALEEGQSVHDIADMLGVHESTVYREMKRGRRDKELLDKKNRLSYDPVLAQRRFRESILGRVKNAGRPKKKN